MNNPRRRTRRTVHRRAASPSPHNQTQRTNTTKQRNNTTKTIPTTVNAPYAALSIATSGIHPTTARLIALSIAFYSPTMQPLGAWTQTLNPGTDPGPQHLHGYTPEQLTASPTFTTSATTIREALSGRHIIMHQAGYTWGFIMHEYKRSQRHANRNANRNRLRGRARNRTRPIHHTIPTPEPREIIDTLATARRQSTNIYDPRLRSIAQWYTTGTIPPRALPHIGATASHQRASLDPNTLLEADAHLIMHLHQTQQEAAAHGAGTIESINPTDLTADPFGIQRSSLRVEAAGAPRPHENPGTWRAGEPLVQGMEFVLSPDITNNPDELIGKGMAAGLVYSEKLNRRSSLVVCNNNHELRGKAMHAQRKGIPLITDTDFLTLLGNVAPGTRMTTPSKPHAGRRPTTRRIPAPTRRLTWGG